LREVTARFPASEGNHMSRAIIIPLDETDSKPESNGRYNNP